MANKHLFVFILLFWRAMMIAMIMMMLEVLGMALGDSCLILAVQRSQTGILYAIQIGFSNG